MRNPNCCFMIINSCYSFFLQSIAKGNCVLNWPHIKEDKQSPWQSRKRFLWPLKCGIVYCACSCSSIVALFCFISRIIESPNDLQYHNGFTILLIFPNPEFFNWSRNCFLFFYFYKKKQQKTRQLGFEAVSVYDSKSNSFFFSNFMNHNNNKKTRFINL